MADTPAGSYRIAYSQRVVERLKALADRAAHAGFGPELVAALKTIVQSLTDNPCAWGDPNYRLRALDLLVCHGIHFFLHVRYAVDEDRKIVYITEIESLPGHPLSQGP